MAFYIGFKEVITREPVSVTEEYTAEKMVAVVDTKTRNKVVAIFNSEPQARNWVSKAMSGFEARSKTLEYVAVDVDMFVGLHTKI